MTQYAFASTYEIEVPHGARIIYDQNGWMIHGLAGYRPTIVCGDPLRTALKTSAGRLQLVNMAGPTADEIECATMPEFEFSGDILRLHLGNTQVIDMMLLDTAIVTPRGKFMFVRALIESEVLSTLSS